MQIKNSAWNKYAISDSQHGSPCFGCAESSGWQNDISGNTLYCAAAGNLGYELDLQKLSQDEMELIKKQIAQYKRIRRTVQFGAYYRLADPFSENQSAWNFVSEDGKQIVFSHVQILARSAYRIPTLRLRGLDPKAEYKNVETGEVFGGDELMYAGITIPRVRQDFSATMIIFEKM